MSGICGLVFTDKRKQLSPYDLLRMLGAMGQGETFTSCHGFIGMGAQKFPDRLAGVADMVIHGQPLVLAFHGSLYNLRDLLSPEENSYPVKGLLGLYLKQGMEFLRHLRGDFALALWDGRVESLHLTTDRFRVHPLLYYEDPEKVVFASRMKGILACPFPVNRTINPEAIVDVVASSIIPTPKTIFMKVKKMPPGHLLTYQKGNIRSEPYWKISFFHPSAASESTLAQQFRTRLTEAVSICLKVDEASNGIGTFLSGGVDSSTVTGVLTQLVKHPVKSFSIGFDEERFNEIDYARIAARAFGAEHYEYFVSPEDTYNTIPILVEEFDEPYGNASAVPTYFCAKMAREHGVDILYAGDGGDELFAGNERYATQRLFEYYHKIPTWFREPLVKPLVFALADGLEWGLFVKGKKYIQRAGIPYHERITSYDFFKVVSVRDFLEDGLMDKVGRDYNPYAPFSFYYFEAPARNNLDRHLYVDWKLTISDNDILKFRMAEAAGIPVRFPFLDYRLAEFSMTVPAHIKMRGTKLRSFQKKAYADLLPLEIRTKKKHGFGLPIPVWLRTDRRLNEMMYDLVLSPRSVQRGYFGKKALEALVERHKTDETSFYGTVLWHLMILELWHRKYRG